jgi:intein/homing endonuclease
MQLEVKPGDVRKTDKVLMNKLDYEWYKFNKIESCKNLGEFEDEYVYDIEMADDSHTFIANDILIHNGVHKKSDN